jgi:hypothetical protein
LQEIESHTEENYHPSVYNPNINTDKFLMNRRRRDGREGERYFFKIASEGNLI